MIFRQDGRWVGIEADLGRALGHRLGMNPVFVAYPPHQLTAALLAGKVDILMAGLSITEDRRVQMDFSTPYLVVGQTALIRSEELLRYNTEIKIRSTTSRVGVVESSTGERLVSRYFTQATRRAFTDANDAVNALIQNQIDLVIYDAPAAWWLGLRHGQLLSIAPVLFAREEVAWAFRRGSVSLREAVNDALADWHKDGTLESTLHRWIPFSK
jgi:polar amino acid transport system substrate-binding protein